MKPILFVLNIVCLLPIFKFPLKFVTQNKITYNLKKYQFYSILDNNNNS